MDRDVIRDIIDEIKGIAYDMEVMPLFDVLERFGDWEESRILKRLKDIREKINRTQEQQAQRDEEQYSRDFVEIGIGGSIDGPKVAMVRFITSISRDTQEREFGNRYVLVINDDPEGRVLLRNFNVQYRSEKQRDAEYDRIKKCLANYTNIRFL